MEIVRSSSLRKSDRILLYGLEGLGKSSWAAQAPNALFIDLEDGLGHLDVPCIQPKDFKEFASAIKNVPEGYRTLVIDTADALESMLWDYTCTKNGWKSIEDPGYGKGYVAAMDIWKALLGTLEALRNRGIEVIILAHAAPKIFANPSGPDYSRYEPKLHRGAAALLKEWSDCIFFACHEETARIVKGEQKAKAVGTGNRIVHTTHAPAWDAKNRFDLPETLPLDYAAFTAAREEFRARLAAKVTQAQESSPPAAPTPVPQKAHATKAAPARPTPDAVKVGQALPPPVQAAKPASTTGSTPPKPRTSANPSASGPAPVEITVESLRALARKAMLIHTREVVAAEIAKICGGPIAAAKIEQYPAIKSALEALLKMPAGKSAA